MTIHNVLVRAIAKRGMYEFLGLGFQPKKENKIKY